MSKQKRADAKVVEAARDLAAALEVIETATSRSSKVELTSQRDLARAAELLAEAEAGHRDFLAHLGALATAVDDMRQRQNASAAALSTHEERLVGRRAAYEALERRFGLLAETASSVGAALASAHERGDGEAKEAMRKVRDRMGAAIDEARVLSVDAKEERFAELERQAHAIRQQLASLLDKIAGAVA